MNPLGALAWACFLVFMASVVGVLPLRFFSKLSLRSQGGLMGLSAGVMLGATFFSLLLPGIEGYKNSGYTPLMSAFLMSVGLLVGALFLHVFHHFLPHEHFIKGVEGEGKKASRQILLATAIALHNFPEGLAVGVGLTQENSLMQSLTFAIAFQDVPEGFVVGMSLLAFGIAFKRIFWIAVFMGLIEVLGAVLGFLFVQVVQNLLSFALAFCSGAMLFVVSREMIPESHREGIEDLATLGLFLGFIFVMLLDVGFSH